jgi:hypothetical protein
MLALAGPVFGQKPGGPPGPDEVFQLTAVIQVPVTGQGASTFFSFDISWFDPVLNKYFLADRNNKSIDVVDATTFAITQFVNPGFAGFTGNNDTSGPDGVLTVHQPDGSTQLWVGDSPGKVWVLDAITGAPVVFPAPMRGPAPTNPILVGGTGRADEVCYDSKDHLLMVQSPAEDPPFVSIISTQTYQVVGKIPFDGTKGTPLATNGIEQCGWSPTTGMFYINVPEVNGPGNDTAPGATSVISPASKTVVNNFPIPITLCAGPQGMAIGQGNQMLLGCNAKSPDGHRNTVIIDQTSGAVTAVLADLGGDDEVWFNPADGHYFIASCNTPCRTVPGTGPTGPELLGVVDASANELDQSVVTAVQNGATAVLPGNPRTLHSVAAGTVFGQTLVFLPIPAVGGNAPQFSPSLCDQRGANVTVIGAPSTAIGCIAVVAAFPDNDDNNIPAPRMVEDLQAK